MLLIQKVAIAAQKMTIQPYPPSGIAVVLKVASEDRGRWKSLSCRSREDLGELQVAPGRDVMLYDGIGVAG